VQFSLAWSDQASQILLGFYATFLGKVDRKFDFLLGWAGSAF
jgi:hypothetical protein